MLNMPAGIPHRSAEARARREETAAGRGRREQSRAAGRAEERCSPASLRGESDPQKSFKKKKKKPSW